jgi:Redoxin
MKHILSALATLSLLAATGCKQDTPAKEVQPTSASASLAANNATSLPAVQALAIGADAADFELKDTDGKATKLSSFKGKIVVLEWFNPGCPFVKNAHTKGPLVTTAKRTAEKGVIWLAVNSSAAGKEGAGAQANNEAKTKYNLTHPVLLDEDGKVGHMYGATNTPHMVVIDAAGKLAYRGAADNSPDGEGDSPTGGKLVNYIDTTVEALLAGKNAPVPETKAYGCGVKYAK